MAEQKKIKTSSFMRFFGLDEASQRKDFDKRWDDPDIKAKFIDEAAWLEAKEEAWKNGDKDKTIYMTFGAHKGLGRSGPLQILVNSIGTDNLDALFYDCAPGLTRQANSTYELTLGNSQRLKRLCDKLDDDNRYQELKGKYDELQKHYDELKKERDTLVQGLVENAKAGRQR